MVKEVIILAGGLGTRLRKVVPNVPKPMVNINGKPFLEYLLLFLKKQGIEKVILSVGYKYEIIKNYFGNFFEGMELKYSIEKELLGTGGAIKKSLSFVEEDMVFILNGDTLFKINFESLYSFHTKKQSYLTVALKYMKNFSRYGCVEIDKDNKIVSFKEKGFYKEGLINGGIYLLNKEFYLFLAPMEKFSFEKEILEKFYKTYNFYGFPTNGYFIDIGVPNDYERAKREFQNFKYI